MPFAILPDKRRKLPRRNISAQHDYPKGANDTHLQRRAVTEEHREWTA